MFRMKLAPTSASPRVQSALAWKAAGLFALALLGIGLVFGWLLGRGARPTALEPDSGPVLLSMQKLGDLHTASFVMKDVLRQESQAEPDTWVSVIPGASNIVHWATHNQALVVAEGNVEAGIDLSQLSAKDVNTVKLVDGTTHLQVHLPAVHIYPPNVRIHVENEKDGMFWRDPNILPKAEAQARSRFQQAAERGGIREKAQKNAVELLQRLQHALGHNNVDFRF